MATLPDIKPDYSIPKNMVPRVLAANLGDGYQQRAADGINSMPQQWQLMWSNRTYTNINTLDNFFIARAGHESFDWTPLRESSSRKFICTDWSRNFDNPDNDTLMATFIEVWEY